MRTRASLAVFLAAGAALAAACDATGVDATRGVRGALRLELASGAAAQQPGSVSNVQRVRLSVTPAGAGAQPDRVVAFGTGRREAAFDVTVPVGSARFRAEVLSNRDVLLLDGDVTAPVDRDGFQVVVPLVARRPVLLATRDTTTLTRSVSLTEFLFAGTITVSNPGAGSLVWRVDSAASTAMTSISLCDGPCLHIDPASGSVAAGGSMAVKVGTFFQVRAPLLTLRLTSAEGYVDLVVRVPQTGAASP